MDIVHRRRRVLLLRSSDLVEVLLSLSIVGSRESIRLKLASLTSRLLTAGLARFFNRHG